MPPERGGPRVEDADCANRNAWNMSFIFDELNNALRKEKTIEVFEEKQRC